MIKPRRLEPGMTIGVIAPASGIQDPSTIDAGIAGLKELGFTVREGRHLRKKFGYLAARDTERLADLHAMFADPKIHAVMCMRGGYGTGRLAPFVDYGLIRANPKVFVGFSDITMLHLAIWRKCQLVTFNGPMLMSAFAPNPARAFTIEGFLRTLTRREASGSIWQGHADREYQVVRHGSASGRLTGGNLSLVAASVGTPFEIDTRGKIVLLEEIDEKPYRIDRMLTQLLLAGKLADAAAVVFGRNVLDAETAQLQERAKRPSRGSEKNKTSGADREYMQSIDEVIIERLRGLGIPVLIGLPFGHIDDYATLPIGVKASMNTRTGDLTIDEPAVK